VLPLTGGNGGGLTAGFGAVVVLFWALFVEVPVRIQVCCAVAAKLGPAPAQVVLTSLLQGSHFDYMILARPDRPNIVQRVILTPASGSGLASNASGVQPRIPTVLNQGDPDADEAEEANVPQPVPQIQQLQPQPQQQPQPAQQSGTAVQGNGSKTPEQVLEELNRLQKQQQQNQQNPQQTAPLKPRIPQ